MIKGSCLCQQVQYEYNDRISETGICHCDLCKRASGSVFAVNGTVVNSKLEITKGEELLKPIRSSQFKQRFFCSNCGTHIYSRGDNESFSRLRLGTVIEGGDENISAPQMQIFGNYKPKWFNSDAPCYKEGKGSELE